MKRRPLSLEQFCRIVGAAVESLPAAFHAYIENVVVDVQDQPTEQDLAALDDREDVSDEVDLLGLFVGVPITQQAYGDHHPNVIKIFRRPMLAASPTRSILVRNIKATVIHELAHHFGFSE